MTLPAALRGATPFRFGWRDLGLWSGAAALVLGVHVAAAYGVRNFNMTSEADGGPPPAQTIDVMPMVVMPAVEEQVATLDVLTPDQSEPAPDTEIAPEEPADETVPVVDRPDMVPPDETDPTRTEAAEQTAAPDAIAPDETDPAQTDAVPEADQPPLDEVVPDIVQATAPEVVIPLPQPKPVEIAKEKKRPAPDKAQKPVVEKVKKPVDKPKPRPRKDKAPPSRTVTVASADAPPAARTAAPTSAQSASSSGGVSKWKSRLRSWINRHKRYPSAAKARRSEGTVTVAFNVDLSGRVTSVRIIGSSGDADLDRSALDMLRGATVPAPPEGVNSLVRLPLGYTLRD
ncbi:energy transducer TonB [Mesorhizobium sp. ES1-1]|uniref:energy transducer TonB n=1 Tax=Mesorhizobium sp. ES1-1 TaxID=2876629 RepID=UPI001CCE71E7|nr:energy transducer TonB [Mesorhizobium sp. ES1-1]MBZ9675435.1 TonB family protein [Mesorhizobium sp. ES1-1]